MHPAHRTEASLRLVERDAELAVLVGLVDAAADWHGGSARVLGPAGVGKTALIRALRDHAVSGGARVWLTTAGQLETHVPFGVARRLLGRALRDLPCDQRAALQHGPAGPALAQLWDGGAALSHPRTPAQGDVLHGLGWLLEELAALGPLVLIVDDAQWADEESLLFLGTLRDRLLELPVVTLVAARDELVDRSPGLAALVADRDAAVLRLGPLSGPGVDALLHERWPVVSEGTAAAVREVTGGNPFLVHALADTLGGQPADVDPAVVHSTVPDTVLDLMVARLAALPAAEQDLARAVAVLDAATLPVAAAVAGIDPAHAPAAADHLRRAGLFAATPVLAFRHALLRSAVYAMVGPDTRDQLHRSAARLLSGSAARDRSRAAAHLLSSSGIGDPWSVDLLRTAAADALAVGAPQSAVALLERAVDEPADASRLPAVLHELGQAQARMFDPGCVETFQRAAALTADPVARAGISLAIATAYSYAGLHRAATETLAALRPMIAGTDRELELTVDAAWAATAMQVPGEVAVARRRLGEYRDLAGATVGERLVLIQQLTAAAGANQPAAVIRAYADRVIGDWGTPEQFPETGDWVWPRIFLAQIGDFDTVRRLTDDGFDHAEAQGSVAGMVTAAFVRGFAELHAGRLLDAERYHRRMLEPGPAERGPGRGLLVDTLAYGGLGQCLALQGRTDEALDLLSRFPEQLPAEAPVVGAAMICYGRAVVRHEVGDHLGALAAAEQVGRLAAAVDIDSPTWAPWRALAIGPLRSLGRLDEARTAAADHLELCRLSEVPHLIGEALCLSATVAADSYDGIDLARRGVASLCGTGSRWREGVGSLTLGSLLRRTGNRVEAREHLRTAAYMLEECGAAATAAFARSELAATGARLTRSDPRTLTPSERRVTSLALEGLTNREIAARLHVTRKTVETHLSASYRKLGVTGRGSLTPDHLG